MGNIICFKFGYENKPLLKRNLAEAYYDINFCFITQKYEPLFCFFSIQWQSHFESCSLF